MKRYLMHAVGTAVIGTVLYATVITLAELSQFKITFVASLFTLGIVSFLLVCEVMRDYDKTRN